MSMGQELYLERATGIALQARPGTHGPLLGKQMLYH